MSSELQNSKLIVSVKSRNKKFFEGSAISISSINDKGPFDILPAHANFITMVRDYIKVVVDDKNAQNIVIKTGVMRVFENTVHIYLTVT